MTIEYEGVDISGNVAIDSYVHESFAEEHGDILKIVFNDSEARWDKWGPKEGDTIKLIEGQERSGTMYVREVLNEPSICTIVASSYPVAMDTPRSQSWKGITLKGLASDISKRYGLTLDTYGVQDHKFSELRQRNESDLAFLEKLAVLCGCAFIIYDNKMVMYKETELENQTIKETMEITGANGFRYKTKPEYTGCKVTDGTTEYLYGTTENVVVETIDIAIASKGEAQLFAENLLKYKNKFAKSGHFYVNSKEVTAGTMFNIATGQANSFNGAIFVNRVRYTEGRTKVFFRKV